MGKNSRKNKARMPHANNRDEVIQRAKEQAAANKPPLTEEPQQLRGGYRAARRASAFAHGA